MPNTDILSYLQGLRGAPRPYTPSQPKRSYTLDDVPELSRSFARTAPKIDWKYDWSRYGYQYDEKSPFDVARKQVGLPPASVLKEYDLANREDATRLSMGMPSRSMQERLMSTARGVDEYLSQMQAVFREKAVPSKRGKYPDYYAIKEDVEKQPIPDVLLEYLGWREQLGGEAGRTFEEMRNVTGEFSASKWASAAKDVFSPSQKKIIGMAVPWYMDEIAPALQDPEKLYELHTQGYELSLENMIRQFAMEDGSFTEEAVGAGAMDPFLMPSTLDYEEEILAFLRADQQAYENIEHVRRFTEAMLAIEENQKNAQTQQLAPLDDPLGYFAGAVGLDKGGEHIGFGDQNVFVQRANERREKLPNFWDRAGQWARDWRQAISSFMAYTFGSGDQEADPDAVQERMLGIDMENWFETTEAELLKMAEGDMGRLGRSRKPVLENMYMSAFPTYENMYLNMGGPSKRKPIGLKEAYLLTSPELGPVKVLREDPKKGIVYVDTNGDGVEEKVSSIFVSALPASMLMKGGKQAEQTVKRIFQNIRPEDHRTGDPSLAKRHPLDMAIIGLLVSIGRPIWNLEESVVNKWSEILMPKSAKGIREAIQSAEDYVMDWYNLQNSLYQLERQNWPKFNQWLSQVTPGLMQMAVVIGAGMATGGAASAAMPETFAGTAGGTFITKAATMIPFAGYSYGSYYNSALLRGASEEAANNYALAMSAVEILTEAEVLERALRAPAQAMGKGLTKSMMRRGATRLAKVGATAITALQAASMEAAQEALAGGVDKILFPAMTGGEPDNESVWSEVAAGALMGLVFMGLGSASNSQANRTAYNIIDKISRGEKVSIEEWVALRETVGAVPDDITELEKNAILKAYGEDEGLRNAVGDMFEALAQDPKKAGVYIFADPVGARLYGRMEKASGVYNALNSEIASMEAEKASAGEAWTEAQENDLIAKKQVAEQYRQATIDLTRMIKSSVVGEKAVVSVKNAIKASNEYKALANRIKNGTATVEEQEQFVRLSMSGDPELDIALTREMNSLVQERERVTQAITRQIKRGKDIGQQTEKYNELTEQIEEIESVLNWYRDASVTVMFTDGTIKEVLHESRQVQVDTPDAVEVGGEGTQGGLGPYQEAGRTAQKAAEEIVQAIAREQIKEYAKLHPEKKEPIIVRTKVIPRDRLSRDLSPVIERLEREYNATIVTYVSESPMMGEAAFRDGNMVFLNVLEDRGTGKLLVKVAESATYHELAHRAKETGRETFFRVENILSERMTDDDINIYIDTYVADTEYTKKLRGEAKENRSGIIEEMACDYIANRLAEEQFELPLNKETLEALDAIPTEEIRQDLQVRSEARSPQEIRMAQQEMLAQARQRDLDRTLELADVAFKQGDVPRKNIEGVADILRNTVVPGGIVLDYGASEGGAAAQVYSSAGFQVETYAPGAEGSTYSSTRAINKTYDGVVLTGVLNTVRPESGEAIIKHIGSLLNKDGVAVVSAANWEGADQGTVYHAAEKDDGGFSRGFSENDLTAYVVSVLGTNGYWYEHRGGAGVETVIIHKGKPTNAVEGQAAYNSLVGALDGLSAAFDGVEMDMSRIGVSSRSVASVLADISTAISDLNMEYGFAADETSPQQALVNDVNWSEIRKALNEISDLRRNDGDFKQILRVSRNLREMVRSRRGREIGGDFYVSIDDVMNGRTMAVNGSHEAWLKAATAVVNGFGTKEQKEIAAGAPIVGFTSDGAVRFLVPANLGSPHPFMERGIRVMPRADVPIRDAGVQGQLFFGIENILSSEHPLQRYYMDITAMEERLGLLNTSTTAMGNWARHINDTVGILRYTNELKKIISAHQDALLGVTFADGRSALGHALDYWDRLENYLDTEPQSTPDAENMLGDRWAYRVNRGDLLSSGALDHTIPPGLVCDFLLGKDAKNKSEVVGLIRQLRNRDRSILPLDSAASQIEILLDPITAARKATAEMSGMEAIMPLANVKLYSMKQVRFVNELARSLTRSGANATIYVRTDNHALAKNLMGTRSVPVRVSLVVSGEVDAPGMAKVAILDKVADVRYADTVIAVNREAMAELAKDDAIRPKLAPYTADETDAAMLCARLGIGEFKAGALINGDGQVVTTGNAQPGATLAHEHRAESIPYKIAKQIALSWAEMSQGVDMRDDPGGKVMKGQQYEAARENLIKKVQAGTFYIPSGYTGYGAVDHAFRDGKRVKNAVEMDRVRKETNLYYLAAQEGDQSAMAKYNDLGIQPYADRSSQNERHRAEAEATILRLADEVHDLVSDYLRGQTFSQIEGYGVVFDKVDADMILPPEKHEQIVNLLGILYRDELAKIPESELKHMSPTERMDTLLLRTLRSMVMYINNSSTGVIMQGDKMIATAIDTMRNAKSASDLSVFEEGAPDLDDVEKALRGIKMDNLDENGYPYPDAPDVGKKLEPETTQGKAFKEWFGNSVVTDKDGNPLVVFAGAQRGFNHLDSPQANPDCLFGAGFYLSGSAWGSNTYYAGTGTVEEAAFSVYAQGVLPESVTQEQIAEVLRRENPDFSLGAVLPVYVRAQNAVIAREDGGTQWMVEDGTIDTLMDAIESVSESWRIDAQAVINELAGQDVVTVDDVVSAAQDYLDRPGEFLRHLFTSMGYDEIIYSKSDPNLPPGADHYIVFSQDQISLEPNGGQRVYLPIAKPSPGFAKFGAYVHVAHHDRQQPAYLRISRPYRIVDNGDVTPKYVLRSMYRDGLILHRDYRRMARLSGEALEHAMVAALVRNGHDGIVYLNRTDGLYYNDARHRHANDRTFAESHNEAQQTWIPLYGEQIVRPDEADVGEYSLADHPQYSMRRRNRRLYYNKQDILLPGLHERLGSSVEKNMEKLADYCGRYGLTLGELKREIEELDARVAEMTRAVGKSFIEQLERAKEAIDRTKGSKGRTVRGQMLKAIEAARKQYDVSWPEDVSFLRANQREQAATNEAVRPVNQVDELLDDMLLAAEYDADKLRRSVPLRSTMDILNELSTRLKLGIYHRRFRQRGAYAYYMESDRGGGGKYIRTDAEYQYDPRTLLHEIGHALDDRYGLYSLAKPLEGKIMEQANAFVKARYPKEGWVRESIAEFLLRYFYDKTKAQQLHPELFEAVEEKLSQDKALTKLLDKKRLELQRYITATDIEKMAAHIRPHIGRRVEVRLDKLRSLLEDDLAFLEDLVKTFERITGEKLPADQNPYLYAHWSRKANFIASAMLTNKKGAIATPDGNIVEGTVSLVKLLEPVNQNRRMMAEYNIYLLNRRAIELYDVGKRAIPGPAGENVDAMRKTVAELEAKYPEFKPTAEKMYQWWNTFVDVWLVNTGLVEPGFMEMLRETQPNYVPLLRYRTDKKGGGNVRTISGIQNPIRRFVGDSADVYAPVESMVMLAERYVRLVKQREIALRLDELYHLWEKTGTLMQPGGMGHFMSRISDPVERTTVDLERYKRQLLVNVMEAGVKLEGKDLAEFRGLLKQAKTMEDVLELMGDYHVELFQEAIDSVLADTMQFFRVEPGNPESDDPAILHIQKAPGVYARYEINKDYVPLLQAMMRIDHGDVANILRSIRIFTRIFTSAVTTLRIPFWFTNAFRDTGQASITTKDKGTLPFQYLKNIVLGLRDIAKNSDEYKMYRAMGMTYGASIAGMLRSKASETLGDLRADMKEITGAGKYSKAKTVLRRMGELGERIIGTMEAISDFIETVPRYAEFKTFLQQTEDTPGNRIQAAYNAMDVTLNFQRAGTLTRQLNYVIPFFNAGVQGLSKVIRSLSDPSTRTKTLIRSLVFLTLPTLMLALLNKDDEDYHALEPGMRDNYWHLFKTEDGKWIRIPKPREYAFLFSTLFDRVFNDVFTEEVDPYDELWTVATDMFFPSGRFVWAPIAQDIPQNRTWSGGKIVPAYMEDWAKEAQFDNSTSVIAVWLGRQLGWSPKNIHYAISQMLGGPGRTLMTSTAKSTGAGRAIEGMSRTFRSDIAYSNKYVSSYYDLLDELNSRKKAPKGALKKPFSAQEQQALNILEEISPRLSELWNRIHEIEDKPTAKLSSGEKDRMIRELRLEIYTITRSAYLRAKALLK